MKTLTKSKLEIMDNPTKKITGSEALLLSLIEEGVDTIFGYPGGAIMPLYDLLYDYKDKINHILVRHEQGAAHAAQGYARVTGKPGVCFVTSGPGATNLVTGLADAMIDSTPIICISGQVTSTLLGSDAFQESDVIGISMPVTKWNFQVSKAEEIPLAISKAFYIAKTGRPGPVIIDLTKDAQFEEFSFTYKRCNRIRSYIPYPAIDLKKVEQAAAIINKAQKPLALIGQGVILSGAEAELKTFLEKTGIPAAWTLLGNSAFPHNHPLNVGMLGMHGNYGPNIKTNECDVLIALGMRFDDRVTGDTSKYAKQAKVIHCDIDPSEVDKNIKSDVAIIADLKDTLQSLIPRVKENSHSSWLGEFENAYKTEYERVIYPELHPETEELTMGEVISKINDFIKGDAILVTDVGQHQMVASRYFKVNSTRSVVTSGGLGTMGFGLPASIGAKIGRPDKLVVAVIGDGGFQMTIQELGTMAQSQVAVKIILINNNFLGMVRQWQQLFFNKRYSFTELMNPDFITIAKGYGIKGRRVAKRDELDAAITEMFNQDGPFLLDVKVKKEGNVFPMVPAGASVSDIRLE